MAADQVPAFWSASACVQAPARGVARLRGARCLVFWRWSVMRRFRAAGRNSPAWQAARASGDEGRKRGGTTCVLDFHQGEST